MARCLVWIGEITSQFLNWLHHSSASGLTNVQNISEPKFIFYIHNFYARIVIFVRIHWVKQIHTRTVVKDGVVQERKTTERVLIHQDGDEPPEELQDSINQLADDFINYDIKPPPSDDSTEPPPPPPDDSAATGVHLYSTSLT